MIELTTGQKAVLIATSLPMAIIGGAGMVASYQNFTTILDQGSMALSVVLAGEGATLVSALVYLLLTLLGQHTPKVVRLSLWTLPLVGAVAGVSLASTDDERVVMAVAPLAMTVAAEGVALVARRVVAFQTGVDLEQQRRSGLLLWHANRAANGGWIGSKLSRASVWRLTRQFASTDHQMAVQLADVQRFRIGEGVDANLSRVLAGGAAGRGVKAPKAPVSGPEAVAELPAIAPLLNPEPARTAPLAAPEPAPEADNDDGFEFVRSVLTEAEAMAERDDTVRLLTVADVAALKNVSTGAVRTWVHRGKLPVHDRDGNRSLFHPMDVDALK